MKSYKNGVNEEKLYHYIANPYIHTFYIMVPLSELWVEFPREMLDTTDIIHSILYAMLICFHIESPTLKGQYFIQGF